MRKYNVFLMDFSINISNFKTIHVIINNISIDKIVLFVMDNMISYLFLAQFNKFIAFKNKIVNVFGSIFGVFYILS